VPQINRRRLRRGPAVDASVRCSTSFRPLRGASLARRAVGSPSPLAANHFSEVFKMHATATCTQHLNQWIRRIICMLRRRPMTFETKFVIALPPFIKIEVGLKNEPPAAANDNHPRRRPAA
jgi:hypothetical protein